MIEPHSKSVCPCSTFETAPQVFSALSSSHKTQQLIDWIQNSCCQGNQHNNPVSESSSRDYPCSGSRTQKCKRRIRAAYYVLNGIRDACRVLLENERSFPVQNVATKSDTIVSGKGQSYDEAFPSLKTSVSDSDPNAPKTKQISRGTFKQLDQLKNRDDFFPLPANSGEKGETRLKVKRRITPAQIASKNSNLQGNISSISGNSYVANHCGKNDKPLFEKIQTSTPSSILKSEPSSPNVWTVRMKNDGGHGIMKSSTKQNPNIRNATFQKSRFAEENEKQSSPTIAKSSKSLSQSKACSDDSDILLKNTVNVYCAIIKTQLAPSVILELQLMLRLLTVRDEDRPINNEPTKAHQDLTTLFFSSESCRQFASRVLATLKNLIVNIHPEILLKLLGITDFVKLLPELAQEIQEKVECHSIAVLVQGGYVQHDGRNSELVSGMNTIITLPFQHERDSRHNFRSKDLSSIYNNREKCRDSFLSQLRAFQQMRITMINPTEVQRSLDDIQVSLVRMKTELLPSNIIWFVEFFTDLLLQIGLVPMQELDDEILKNVADKHRLQKLHSRFTSNLAQKNKSAKPLVLIDDSSTANSSAEQFFTGHQEFFFIFIKVVDSYAFNIHLKQRLVHLILQKSSTSETKGIEVRVNELKMLAKFLGMLTFSPNWVLNESSNLDSMSSTFVPPVIPINSVIEQAYIDRKLVVVLPWILSFLWMMSWDSISIKHQYYKHTFSILRSIHKSIMDVVFSQQSNLAKNLLLIAVQLDTFFSEVVGLWEIDSLEAWQLPFIVHDQDQEALDSSVLDFSKHFMLSVSSHIDDFHKLLVDIELNGRFASAPSASKKLRPHSLCNKRTDALSSSTHEPFSTLEPLGLNHIQEVLVQNPIIEGMQSVRNLTDKFFHQHKEIKQLCEFVVTFSIEHILYKTFLDHNLSHTVKKATINIFQNENITYPIDLDWYLMTLQRIEKDVKLLVNMSSQKILKGYVIKVMGILTPPYVDAAIQDIAIALVVDHTLQKGDIVTMSLIRSQTKREVDQLLRDTHKIPGHQSCSFTPKLNIAPGTNLTNSVQELITLLEESRNLLAADVYHAAFSFDIFLEKIAYISGNFKSFRYTPHDHDHDLPLRILTKKLIQLITNVLSNCTFNTRSLGDYCGKFLRVLIEMVSDLTSMGFGFDEFHSISSTVSRPSVLMSLFSDSQIDSNWFQDILIKNELLRKIDLFDGLTTLLEVYDISQETASMAILILDNIR